MIVRSLTIQAEVLLHLGSGYFSVIANALPVNAKLDSVSVGDDCEILLFIESAEFKEEDRDRPLEAPTITRLTFNEECGTSSWRIVEIQALVSIENRARQAVSRGNANLKEELAQIADLAQCTRRAIQPKRLEVLPSEFTGKHRCINCGQLKDESDLYYGDKDWACIDPKHPIWGKSAVEQLLEIQQSPGGYEAIEKLIDERRHPLAISPALVLSQLRGHLIASQRWLTVIAGKYPDLELARQSGQKVMERWLSLIDQALSCEPAILRTGLTYTPPKSTTNETRMGIPGADLGSGEDWSNG